MTNPLLYLDHAATTPLCEAAVNAMAPWLGLSKDGGFGNPSSLHGYGQRAKQAIEQARETIQKALGITSGRLTLTSGATESTNAVIRGVVEHWRIHRPDDVPHIIISNIEHEATLEPCRYLAEHGWIELTRLPVDPNGHVCPNVLKQAIRPNTALVSVIAAHNEVGTLQDINTLGQVCREAGVWFHTDVVQWVGKHPLALNQLPVDFASWSAHKCYGPKGVGGLYVAQGLELPPLILGGGQEFNHRSGTENVAGIVGMAAALQQAAENLETRMKILMQLDCVLRQALMDCFEPLSDRVRLLFNGPTDVQFRIPGLVHVSVMPKNPTQYIQGESLVLRMNLMGFAVSSGSACHSAVIEPSRIIRAMQGQQPVDIAQREHARAMGTVRMSVSHTQTEADMQRAAEALAKAAEKLAQQPLALDPLLFPMPASLFSEG